MKNIKISDYFYFFLLFTCAFSFFLLPFAFADEAWQPANVGINELNLRCVAFDPKNPNIIYVGGERGIYKSIDGGKYFKSVLILSDNEKVNFISINPKNSQIILAASQNGLFETKNSAATWQKIFRGTGELEGNMLSLAINPRDPKNIYLGTMKGLFTSKDQGRSWHKDGAIFSHYPVLFITFSPDTKIIYASTSEGVFKLADEGKNWQKIYVSQNKEKENSSSNDNDSDVEQLINTGQAVKCIAFSATEGKIFLSTSSGVLESLDNGATWHKLTQTGLLNSEVNFLTFFNKNLYAATQGGVFKFLSDKNIWQEIYQGITGKKVLFLAANNKFLSAATDKGFFKMELNSSKQVNLNTEAENKITNFKTEPGILEIHKAAIKYAEVDPNKITTWRKQAALKAVLPEVSVGYNNDTNATVTSATSNGKTTYTLGPDDTSYGWDFSVKWDLGELIWNGDQTSIDSRSKLMAELRQDILDQVTKLYFERQRLKSQVALMPTNDQAAKIEQEIRLQELTASIDALTGGYFSREIEKTRGGE